MTYRYNVFSVTLSPTQSINGVVTVLVVVVLCSVWWQEGWTTQDEVSTSSSSIHAPRTSSESAISTPSAQVLHSVQSGVELRQALADISCSALYCYSNETCAPTANPPNNAQLGGTPYHSPCYIWAHAVVWACGEGQTHRRPWALYISRRLRLTRNVIRTTQQSI